MTTATTTTALLTSLLVLTACGEKAQTATTSRKADDKVSVAGQSAYLAKGFKAGDQVNWEQQTRQRAQSQNEYARVSPKPQ